MLGNHKGYFLSDADRKRLGRVLGAAESAPPASMIAPKAGHLFSAADTYFALPPCETGIPAAYLRDGFDSSSVSFGAAKCCLFKYDRESKRVIQLLDGVGIPTRAIVYNETGWTVNHLVKIAKHKNGTWVVDKGDIEQSKIWLGLKSTTTTGTTTSTTPSPVNLPCQGYCLWTANSGLAWEGPVGGCENRTTTSTTTTTAAPPPTTIGPTTTGTTTTTATSTTAAPCLSAKPTCKLKCVAVTTTSGAWPPAPSTGLTYQLENPGADGCSSPCTCYGQGDPCFTLNAYIESRCIFMVTTTSTTTTTESPSNRQNPCFQVNKFAPTASIPANTFRAARMQGGLGPWQVCKECDPGYRPLYPIGAKPPVLPSENATAVYHQSSCVYDPCSSDLPLPGDYPVGKAVYRAFNWDNLQANWQNALDSADFLRFDLNPGPRPLSNAFLYAEEDGWEIQGLQLPGFQNSLNTVSDPPDRNPLAWYAPNWSICQSCPPGTRPKLPPPRMLPMDTSWWISMRNWLIDDAPNDPDWGYGVLWVEGERFASWGRRHGRLDYAEGTSRLWKWETPCVPGYDCNLCNFAPAWREMYEEDLTETTPAPTTTFTTTTTTIAPCGCRPPVVCPSVAGECARTECVPGGAVATLQCPTTTTNPEDVYCFDGRRQCNCSAITSTTTSTTTASPNCGQCTWRVLKAPGIGFGSFINVWYPTGYCGGDCLCTLPPVPPGTPGCVNGCPGGTFPPNASCGDTYSVSCNMPPVFTSPPPCISCSGTCFFYSVPGVGGGLTGYSWVKVPCPSSNQGFPPPDFYYDSGCCQSLPVGCGTGTGYNFQCGCYPPDVPPTDICQTIQTGCRSTYVECACCNTTSCQRKCSYKGNGYGGWTKIADPCPTTCPCPGVPLPISQSDCDRIDYTCGEIVPTRTSTSTTTGTGTTTSTTTIGPGACCWSNHTCSIRSQVSCVSSGGSFQGAGSVCSPNPCPTTTTTGTPLGRCCVAPNKGSWGCGEGYSQSICTLIGGSWTANATCGPNPLAACGFTTTSTTTTTMLLGACCCVLTNVFPWDFYCSSGVPLEDCYNSWHCSWTAGVTCGSGDPPFCLATPTTSVTPPSTSPPG